MRYLVISSQHRPRLLAGNLFAAIPSLGAASIPRFSDSHRSQIYLISEDETIVSGNQANCQWQ